MCICVYTRNMVCITKFHIVPSSIHPKATVAAVATKLSFSYLQLRKRAQQLIIFFHAICRENKLFFARWHQLLICLYQQDYFNNLIYSWLTILTYLVSSIIEPSESIMQTTQLRFPISTSI